MDVKELRELAKSMGYNIIPIKKKEKLLPCTCGSKRRKHWFGYNTKTGKEFEKLVCYQCGKEAVGATESDVIHNWNEMIRSEQDGCSGTES